MEPAVSRVFADQVYAARAPLGRAHAAPAGERRSAPLVFPLMLLAVNSGGLEAETHLPGFPTTSFVAFALAVPFIQGALFATMNAGTDLARDIQTGFLSRLSLTPMRGVALLAGQLGGVVTLGLVQAVVYLARRSRGRRAPRVRRAPACSCCSCSPSSSRSAFGALGVFAALRTGSGEAVQGLFPVFFVFLFISSMTSRGT